MASSRHFHGHLQGIIEDIFKRSSQTYQISRLYGASTLSLRMEIRDILVQCNRSKLNPNLGVSQAFYLYKSSNHS